MGKIIGSGGFGQVFEVEGGLVAKLSLDTAELSKEIKIIKKLQSKKCKHIINIISYDVIILKNFD